MKQDIAMKWADALESGEFKQTQGRLYDPGEGYCCLGVLCEVVGRKFDCYESQPSTWGIKNHLGTIECTVLPEEIVREVGMKSQSGIFTNNDGDIELTCLNDGDISRNIHPHSFKEIAKIIRENWEAL